MKQKIILLSGFKRSGKDFIAQYIHSKVSNSNIISFAEPMKFIIAKTFGLTLEELDTFKNEPSEYGIELKAYPNNQNQVTFRQSNFREVLQLFGTEGMKPMFGEHVWAELAENRANELGGTIIISDFRFRIEDEVWDKDKYDVITVRIQDDNLAMTDPHASEVDLLRYTFDYYVNNTDKNDSVFIEVDEMLSKEEVCVSQS